MNALFGFLSSPLKKQPEIPPTATMPVSASQQSRTSSPRNHRIPKRASNQFSESEGPRRSPLSRRSNVSSTTSVLDTTGDISITSTRRETIATMPPPSKTPKRKSMGGVQSSSVPKRTTASQRVSSSPRPRPTKRQPSVELGEDSMMSASSRSPAVSSKARSNKNSPATSARSTRTSAANSPATSTTKKRVPMKPNFTAVNSPLAESHPTSSRPSPRAQPRSRRSQVVVEAEESEESEEEAYEEEHQGPEVQEEYEENLEEEQPEEELEEQQPEEELEEDIAPVEEEEEDEEEEAEEDDDEEHGFEQIMDYRWVGDKIELRVMWSDGERTWSPEEVFHEDSPDALFAFWRRRPGGRPDNPENPGTYLVFAIRKHRTYRRKNQVFVEWLGYPPSEGTWESQDYIEQVATDHFDDYMDKLKEAGKVKLPAKGRTAEPLKKKGTAKPVAKGRGRPKGSTKSTLNKTQGKSRVTKR